MLYFSVKVLTVQREYYTFLPEADIPEDRPISAEAMYDVKSLNKKKKKKNVLKQTVNFVLM